MKSFILFIIMIPSVTFSFGNFDSIPWPLFIFLIYGLINVNMRLREKDVLLFLLISIISFLTEILVNSEYNFELHMRLLIQIANVIATISLIRIAKPDIRDLIKVFLAVTVVNLVVGVGQFYTNIFDVLTNSRTDIYRGNTGLFSEPTAYGLFCIFVILNCLLLKQFSDLEKQDHLKVNLTIFLNLLAIIFINQSSSAFLFIILIAFSFSLKLSFIIFYLSIILVFQNFVDLRDILGYRINSILEIVWSQGLYSTLLADESINERVSAVVAPFWGFIIDFGMPHAASQYKITITEFQDLTGGLFWFGGGYKIMNNLGTYFYHFGAIGLIIIRVWVLPILGLNKSNYFLVFVFICLMCVGIPLLHTYVLLTSHLVLRRQSYLQRKRKHDIGTTNRGLFS